MAEEETQVVDEPEDAEEPEEAESTEEETAEEEKPSEPRQPSDEIKVVIILKANRAMVGVQSPDCDPIFTPIEGDLAAVLPQVPALVESANAKWDANPRNPKADLPEPPPSPAPTRTTTASGPAKPKQPSFF